MPSSRSNPLAPYGISMTMSDFGRVCFTQLEEDFPGWSADKLVTHPEQAILFCNTINVMFGKPLGTIPHDVILRALLATRKQGKKKLA